MEEYHRIVRDILDTGEWKTNRTGTRALTIAGMKFEHDMATGYPLLTTKKVPFRLIASELEFFIRGITDKRWLQERNNHIWDEWCNPGKVPYSHDPETQKRMVEESDLGAIYGFQWRHFGAAYQDQHANYDGKGVDQLREIVKKLKETPNDRRMLVSAWNPAALHEMALPPCHYGFQAVVIGDKLNLLWNQRSVDTMLGLPFNIASYGLLLHLLALESGLKEGKLVGFLGDVHIYENHLDGARELLNRDCRAYPLPRIRTGNFSGIFGWEYADTELLGYQSYPPIRMPIAV